MHPRRHISRIDHEDLYICNIKKKYKIQYKQLRMKLFKNTGTQESINYVCTTCQKKIASVGIASNLGPSGSGATKEVMRGGEGGDNSEAGSG
jgi:hypothetical protein